jgi:predicted GTPase
MEWKEFSVIDTGGYIRGSDDVFEAESVSKLSYREADDVIIL